jgi:hypothetical protein
MKRRGPAQTEKSPRKPFLMPSRFAVIDNEPAETDRVAGYDRLL